MVPSSPLHPPLIYPAHSHLLGTLTLSTCRHRCYQGPTKCTESKSEARHILTGLNLSLCSSILPRPLDKLLPSPRGHSLFIKALHFLWILSEPGEGCVQGSGFKGENRGIWECDVWPRQQEKQLPDRLAQAMLRSQARRMNGTGSF